MIKILIPVHHIYEDMELQYPKFRLLEAGVKVVIAGPQKDVEYKGKHGYPAKSDISFDEMHSQEFDGIVIPGGYAPDKLRMEHKLLGVIQQLHKKKALIAFICHGGWIPISAKVLKGSKCTSYVAIKDDMENAGVHWEDKSVVVDGHLISSRTPADLPDFLKAILKFLNSKGG